MTRVCGRGCSNRKMARSDLVIGGAFNKGTIYKDMGMVQEIHEGSCRARAGNCGA